MLNRIIKELTKFVLVFLAMLDASAQAEQLFKIESKIEHASFKGTQASSHKIKSAEAFSPYKSYDLKLPNKDNYQLDFKRYKKTSDYSTILSGAVVKNSKQLGSITYNLSSSGSISGSINLISPNYRAIIKDGVLKDITNKPVLGCNHDIKIEASSINKSKKISTRRSSKIKTANASTLDTTLDILGVYSQDALETAGSYGDIFNFFENQIEVANEAHQTSLSGVTLRLVGIVALPNESRDRFDADLQSIANPEDGIWDAIPTLRDWYGADLVTIAVGGTQSGSICGLAYTPGAVSDLDFMSDYMYSIISADTESCQDSLLAHEVGHNLGANHNEEDAGSGDVIYPYAYGYRFDYPYGDTTVKALTIMSYAPETGFFSWIRNFSNPGVNYDSYATGVANEADNAEVFSNTAPIISAYKNARSSFPKNASSVRLTITKTGSSGAIFNGTLRRSSRAVTRAASTLYWSNSSSGSFSRIIKIANSSSSGRWRYTKSSSVRKGYYKLCQGVCSSAVRYR